MEKDLQAAIDVFVDIFIVDIPLIISLLFGIFISPIRALAAFFEPADGGDI